MILSFLDTIQDIGSNPVSYFFTDFRRLRTMEKSNRLEEMFIEMVKKSEL